MYPADVSVIVPCFNSSKTLVRAVESIASQTLRPAELILVDDCSSDDTWHIMENLKSKYDSGWISLKKLDINAGPAAARNEGWEVATSKYISFLDADDSWHPDKVRIQYGIMSNNQDYALSGHSTKVVTGSEGLIINSYDDSCPTYKTISVASILMSNKLSTPTVMLRRNLNFRFPQYKRYAEDYHLWCSILLANNKCIFIDCDLAYLYKSRYGESGLSSNLLAMEMGVWDVYLDMMRQKKINFLYMFFLIAFSGCKFIRRILLVVTRMGFSKL
jgi:glycosyltransferase involved in cell wall biosynthesis